MADSTRPLQDDAAPGMELTGMFRYMADAARFRDCRNGLSFTVAMEGAYIDLEHAFLGVLPRADRYQLSGEVLELFAGDQSLALFESVYH